MLQAIAVTAAAVLAAALLPACSATSNEEAPVASADAANPYPPGAQTPLFWTAAEWKGHEAAKGKAPAR